MNLKTTLVLLVLAAGTVGLFLANPAKRLGLAHDAPDPAGKGTLDVLENQLTREAISHIEILLRGAESPFVLESREVEITPTASSTKDSKPEELMEKTLLKHKELKESAAHARHRIWTLTGGWSTRKPEMDQLISILSGLRSRFVPEPLDEEDALAKRGLEKPAVTVKVKAGPTEYSLAFGEPSAAGSPFDAPTYLRLDQREEAIRLAPGLVAELSKPADFYLQRRLFTDVERVAKDSSPFGDSSEKVEQLAAKGIELQDKKPDGGTYALAKVNADWELTKPTRDRLDPDKRKSLLQAIPDIWAEQFVAKPDKDLAKYGLKDPQEIIKVTTNSGGTITLLIGNESPTKKTRTITRPSPQVPGMPPQPMTQKIEEHFRYAKLENNDSQIFEIKSDKLKDVFVPAGDLRDSRVARFENKDVTKLELTHGAETITATKDKERWKLEKPTVGDAESSKITDILDKLSLLSARDKEILDKTDPKIDGLDQPQATLAVTIEEETKGEGEAKTKKPPRTLKFTIGRHDTDKKKLYIMDDWGRINVVDDSLQALLTRPATVYRGRRVLDFATKDLDAVEVERAGQKLVALQQKDNNWKLTAPVAADADNGKASQLARDLGNLEVIEHVTDNAKPEDLDKLYGLAKPALSVQMKFTGDKKPETLLIGKQREGKPEYFAKRGTDPGVFVVKKEIVDSLEHESLTYRPLQLWQKLPDDITAVRIAKEGQEEYRLAHNDKGNVWQITGPFEAKAVPTVVQPLTQELAGPRGERCVAHSAKDKELEKYGLEKPYLKLSATVKDGEKTKDQVLLVGKPADQPTGARYAKPGDSDAVYVVTDKFLAAVDHSALDLLDKKLLAIDPTNISSIKSDASGTNLKLDHQDAGWKVVESPAGAPFAADEQIAARVAGVWANLNAEKYAAYGPKIDAAKFGLEKPAWTVTATVKAGNKPAEHTIAVGKVVENSSGDRYVRVDNGPGIAVLPSFIVKDLERTHLDFVDRTLLKFDSSSASGLARKSGAETLEIAKKDDAWRILKPVDLAADDKTVQGLFDQLANLRADSIAAYPAKDVKQYGLDQPAAVVTLRLTAADGKPSEKVLRIGKSVSEKPEQGKPLDRYAQVEGATAVGVLSGALADRLLAGTIAFRDRNLARFADADKATLERDRRKPTFTKVDGTWKLTAPLEAEAEHNDMDDFVNVLARLRADELVSDKPKPTADDLKAYGLDKPTATWRFFSGDKEVLGLLIGSFPSSKGGGKDKRCYAKLTNGDLVFLLDAPMSARVMAEYRNKTLWPGSFDSAQAESLRYSGTAGTFALEKSGDGWQIAGKPGTKVNTAAVNDALAALAGLKPERYVEDRGADMKLYGLEPPEIIIQAEAPSGSRVLHIGRAEGDSKRHYARVAGKDRSDVFVISEADSGKLVKKLADFTQTSKPDATTPNATVPKQ
jgi:hypothetical protein